MIGWEKGFFPFSSIFCSSSCLAPLSLLRWRILYAIPHPIPHRFFSLLLWPGGGYILHTFVFLSMGRRGQKSFFPEGKLARLRDKKNFFMPPRFHILFA